MDGIGRSVGTDATDVLTKFGEPEAKVDSGKSEKYQKEVLKKCFPKQ
jgi:hypothetical protein